PSGYADGRSESGHCSRCSRGSEPVRTPRRRRPSRSTALWSTYPSRGCVRSFATSRNCTLAGGASLRSRTPPSTGRTVRDSATAGPCVRRRDQGRGSSEPAGQPARSAERPCPPAFLGATRPTGGTHEAPGSSVSGMRVCSPHCGLDPETTSGGETYERELLRHLAGQGVTLDLILAR